MGRTVVETFVCDIEGCDSEYSFTGGECWYKGPYQTPPSWSVTIWGSSLRKYACGEHDHPESEYGVEIQSVREEAREI